MTEKFAAIKAAMEQQEMVSPTLEGLIGLLGEKYQVSDEYEALGFAAGFDNRLAGIPEGKILLFTVGSHVQSISTGYDLAQYFVSGADRQLFLISSETLREIGEFLESIRTQPTIADLNRFRYLPNNRKNKPVVEKVSGEWHFVNNVKAAILENYFESAQAVMVYCIKWFDSMDLYEENFDYIIDNIIELINQYFS